MVYTASHAHVCTPHSGTNSALIGFVHEEAERDALRVLLFLRRVGVLPDGPAPLPLPLDSLMELAAVLRLARWEAAGFRMHLDVGLPTADAAFDACVARLEDRTRPASDLPGRALDLLAERSAWHAPRAGLGHALLGDIEEDLLDGLAEFIWQNRHLGRGPNS